ncbi:MAG: adenylate/guanylate cyclase domain-containing protein [Candidatus Methylomirabilaceae bacterium]
MPRLPVGTVTFLFTDIEGSTRLFQQLGDARAADVFTTHRQILRSAFDGFGGQELETQGDGFLVAFHSARDAVQATIEGIGR